MAKPVKPVHYTLSISQMSRFQTYFFSQDSSGQFSSGHALAQGALARLASDDSTFTLKISNFELLGSQQYSSGLPIKKRLSYRNGGGGNN
jgi:hypothetical protein